MNSRIVIAVALLTVMLRVCAHSTVAQSVGDVLISEILFDTESGGYEYVEFYNNGEDSLAVNRLKLAKINANGIGKLYAIESNIKIAPKQYFVVTKGADWVKGEYTVRYPDRLIELSEMPQYNNNSGIVAVVSEDTTILDKFEYSKLMQSPLLQNAKGVALERRSTKRPTQEPGNWFSATSASGYGTPTFENSQSHEILFLENDFVASPDVFSPDGDGYNDLMHVHYQLTDGNLSGNITVYDAQGHLLRRLLHNGVLGYEGDIEWNGTAENGQKCRSGKYIVTIEAFNTSGKKQNSKKVVTLLLSK